MLFLALLLMLAGYTLLYAGLKSGTLWQHPWSPWSDAFSTTRTAQTPPAVA